MGQTKILMIEDDADIREGVRALLEGEGYLVCEADRANGGWSCWTRRWIW